MLSSEIWFVIALLAVWILVISAIASCSATAIWVTFHAKVYRWQIWLCRINCLVGSTAGLFIGFKIGDQLRLTQSCRGLSCLGEILTNLFFGSFYGSCLGAILGAGLTGLILILHRASNS